MTRSGHPRGRRRNADHGGSGPEEPTRHDGGDADTISGGSGPPIVDDSALRGRILGRFVIIDKVGQGGMGEVHRAYDPTLQREVALKLVRTGGRDGGDDDERQQRTLREAQAMARISHPNVVPVFDAWTQGQQVCIAMEYVAGQTLRRWVGDGSRSVEQILAVYVQAGRGLAAAHRQGMVHRDFKPDNVIVDEDGRARVLDFGLALAVSQQDTPAPSEDPPSGDSSPGDWSVSDASASGSERLTRTGAVMGTPAYMAPEQHFGATAEPAADQFAFCVALYEALCGQRPFVGANLAEVARAKSDGRIPPPPESSAVPKHVRLALERGMAVEPTDRWPSMEALLEVLARRRRSRWWWLAGAAAAAGMVSLLLAEPEARCDASQSSLSSAWSDERREATRRGLMKVDAEGEAIAGGVVARLDQYFADWEAQYVDACERTHVRRDQSAALMDRRMQCLDRRLSESRALVEVFVDADADVSSRASRAVARLRDPLDCADVAALGREVERPSDPVVREQIEALEEDLGRARALLIAGQYERGLAAVVPIRERADAVGWGPLRAEALGLEGRLLERSGRLEEAQRRLTDAVWVALEGGADDRAADAAISLAFTVGYARGDPLGAAVWIELARALRARLGVVEVSADLESVSGTVAARAGDYERALHHYRATLAAHRTEDPDDESTIASDLSNVGLALFQLDRLDEAREAYEQSLAIKERTLGPQHPSVATTLYNLGLALVLEERLDDAAVAFERSVAIRQEVLGHDHPYVAVSMQGLGDVARRRGAPQRAIEIFERARVILERALGPEHPDATEATVGIGDARRQLGDIDAARREYEQALRIRMAALGPDHADVAEVRARLEELAEP